MTEQEIYYWCSEGYGFVDKNHRCEQWCSILHIPKKAIEKIITNTKETILNDFKNEFKKKGLIVNIEYNPHRFPSKVRVVKLSQVKKIVKNCEVKNNSRSC